MCIDNNEINIERVKKKRRPPEPPEDFIGWKSEDGNLEVIGLAGRSGARNNVALFKVICKICSLDSELYPEGYFISTKHALQNKKKPCGCSHCYECSEQQALIKASRKVPDTTIIHGFAEKYSGAKTKLDCECTIDGCRWTPVLSNVISHQQGCPSCGTKSAKEKQKTPYSVAMEICTSLCKNFGYKPIGFIDNSFSSTGRAKFQYECPHHGVQIVLYSKFRDRKQQCTKCTGRYRPSEQEAISNCKSICDKENYNFLGFVDGFKNAYSRLEYICQKHGIKNVNYRGFVSIGNRCNDCEMDKRREAGNFYGWYPERAEEQDYLYVMNFDNNYLKVGRSFDVTQRMSELKSDSKCNNITKMAIYTAPHKIIWPTEQEIHDELRDRGFEFKNKTWNSNELFTMDCSFVLKKLLDISGLEKVY